MQVKLKSVLVTGATGFIGENLCRVLSGKDVDLHAMGNQQ